MKRSHRMISFLWAFFLFGFTVFAALDTFVIQHAYISVEVSSNEADSSSLSETIQPTKNGALDATPAIAPDQTALNVTSGPATVSIPTPSVPGTTNTSYADGNITITIDQLRAFDSTVYVADVVLSSPEYLQTALANSVYGRNIKAKTSSIAEDANAILAINGDYYGARSSGYVIRNGVLYRSTAKRNAEDLVIYQDGSFDIINESDITAKELLDMGAWNVLSFGPALIIDGEIEVSERDEVGQAMASNPRTAIGIVDELHYLFVVSDGRTKDSEGLTLYELAEVLESLGAKTAYNLDGGGSSTMVFQGQIINNPTTNGKRISERSVSDIVCITL